MADWAALKAEGNKAYAAGDFKTAVTKYGDVLKLDSLSPADRSTILSNRAQCFIKMSEHAAAAEDCTAALDLDSGNVKALFRRAASREAMGDKSGAVSDYRAVLAAQPGQEESRRAIARLDPSSAVAAGRGRRQRKLTQEEVTALQEAQGESGRLQNQLRQLKQRSITLQQRQRISALTRSEVSKADIDGEMYRHVGKMFARVPRVDHLRTLDAEKASLDKQQSALAKMGEGLEAKARAANSNLKELAAAAGITVAVPGETA